ncbi:hypothetical protein F5Y17DRAFT_455326 [Xylariaceae sp. FL0594]|nr:hypothetical protein F5Y17DRAFT_455326 [Xylariaceae sp. FL0594]
MESLPRLISDYTFSDVYRDVLDYARDHGMIEDLRVNLKLAASEYITQLDPQTYTGTAIRHEILKAVVEMTFPGEIKVKKLELEPHRRESADEDDLFDTQAVRWALLDDKLDVESLVWAIATNGTYYLRNRRARAFFSRRVPPPTLSSAKMTAEAEDKASISSHVPQYRHYPQQLVRKRSASVALLDHVAAVGAPEDARLSEEIKLENKQNEKKESPRGYLAGLGLY